MYFTANDVDKINEQELRDFLQKKYRENRFLDYKLKYEKDSVDKAREEFLADVTSFANYFGGNIIIGVEELEEKGVSAQPGNLIGIEDGKEWADQHRNLCATSIDPPIHGLIIKEIFLNSGKWAVVVHIPPSLRRPHMVCFRKKREFWVRRDDRKGKMTADEVKRTVVEVINIEKNIDSYITMVAEEVIEDFIGDDFGLLMHAVPFLLEVGQIDTSSHDIKLTLMDSSLSIDGIDLRSHFSAIPNIHGIFGGISNIDPYYYTYVHRTGYLGLAYDIQKKLLINEKKDKFLAPYIKNIFLAFLRLCKLVTEKAKISSPYQVRCIFINSKGARYVYHGFDEFTYTSQIVWKRNRIQLPGERLDSFQNIDKVADLFYKRLRNAFGEQ